MSQLRDGSRSGFNGVNYALTSELMTYRNSATTYLTPKMYTTAVATDTSGAVTITLPAGYFTALQFINVTAVRDTANPTLATFAQVRSYTTTSVVVQCFESKTSGVLIGGVVEGLETATAAVVVMLQVVGI